MAMGLAKCEVCSLAGVMRPERRQNGVGIARLSDSALNVVTLEIDVSTTDKIVMGEYKGVEPVCQGAKTTHPLQQN